MKQNIKHKEVSPTAGIEIGDFIEATDVLGFQYFGSVLSKTHTHVLVDDKNQVTPIWLNLTYSKSYNNNNNHETGCDCGAKHTSFPEHHLSWCTTTGKL